MKNLKLILKSLVNNEACVEGGRKRPWFFAVIMLFVSIIICLVPSFVNLANSKGSSFLGNYANGFEIGARRFAEDQRERGINMVVREADGTKYLQFTFNGKSGQEAFAMAYPEVNSFGHHCYKHFDVDNNVDLEVYYLDGELTQDYLNEFVLINEGKVNDKGEPQYSYRTFNYMIFSKYEVRAGAYNHTTKRSVGNLAGDYKFVEEGFAISSLATIVVDGVTYDKDLASTNEGAYGAYVRGTWANWKCFFDTTYLTYKYNSMWQRTLIMAGIDLAIVVFMGLMVYLLTRGKANPYRIYTLWDTQKIVYWAAPAPAILSLIIGFMLSMFIDIGFPLLIGMRLMWLSMKTLRPENAQVVENPKQNNMSSKNAQAKTVASKKK